MFSSAFQISGRRTDINAKRLRRNRNGEFNIRLNYRRKSTNVNLGIEHHKERIEPFSQRRVCKDAISQGRVRQLSHHRRLNNGHDLATFETQDCAAQNLLGISIDDRLHEAARLTGFDRTDDRIHGQFPHSDVAPLSSSLVFVDANPRKLRIYENRIRDNAISNADAAMLKQVGTQNAEVCVRNVSESWPAFDIAQGVDARNIRFQLFIDFNVPFSVQLDAGSLSVESFSVGHATDRRKQM